MKISVLCCNFLYSAPSHLARYGSPNYLGACDFRARSPRNPLSGESSFLVRVGKMILARVLIYGMTLTLTPAEAVSEANVVPGKPIHTVS